MTGSSLGGQIGARAAGRIRPAALRGGVVGVELVAATVLGLRQWT
ncbi:hypothetical protein [Streptomyces decoyicus]|nr:hypothetical protein OG532_39120 [Streptomyces decoyicus]